MVRSTLWNQGARSEHKTELQTSRPGVFFGLAQRRTIISNMEFLSEQERYEAGVLPRELIIPIIGELAVEQESSVPLNSCGTTSGT